MKRVSRAAIAAVVVTFGCMSDAVEPNAPKTEVTPQFVAIGITGGPQFLSRNGFTEGFLEDVNNSGVAVGTLRSGSTSRGVVYPTSGAPVLLAPLTGGNQSQALGINEAGLIVGSSTDASAVTYPVFWQALGAAVRLGGGPSNRSGGTAATDVNENGLIVGFIGSSSGTTDVAAYWDASGQFTQLALPAGAGGAQAHAINDAGDIVGYATFANAQDFRPVLWRAPGYAPQILQIPAGFTGALLRGISNSGVMVGSATKCCVSLTPAVWPDASASAIVFGGGADWIARDVNEDGTVAGGSFAAWVWSPESGKQTLPGTNATATALNDAGVVVGYHNRGSGFEPTVWHVAPLDSDQDGIPDDRDNCPFVANADQRDTDSDGLGDPCDDFPADAENDADHDGIGGDVDNCRATSNPDQSDADQDGLGDVCDHFPFDPENDRDGDGVGGDVDNCRDVPNPDQADSDRDGIGDACDVPDVDLDGVPDAEDNCPTDPNPDQGDADGDGIGDSCDHFPSDPRNDEDRDGIGGDVDNCPAIPNPDQRDADGDNLGDRCDPFPNDPRNDEDLDGIGGEVDNCPTLANPDQADRDGDGRGDVCDPNEAPVVNAGGPYTGIEGTAITFTGTASDGDGNTLTYAWDFNNDGITDATTLSASHTFPDNGTFTVKLTVNDGTVEVSSTTTAVVVNDRPVVTALRLPAGPLAVGTLASIGVDFTDAGNADTHTAVVNWEATSTSPGITGGARSFNASNTFTQSGVFTVIVTVTDDDGGAGSRSSSLELTAYIVVFDPDGGFVTGGGSIVSPSGACRTSVCTAATSGKASFGFVSKYHNGASTPTGNTEFHFKAGDLRFSSTSYEWLVVAGMKAKYKGEGTINGGGRYGFMITAVDGKDDNTPDGFRIKIWDIASGIVVYDNKMGSADDSDDATDIDSGSIVIHK